MNTLFFKDNLVLRDLLTKQITHLYIDMKKPADLCSEIVLNIFLLILSLCEKLTVFNFCDVHITRKCLIMGLDLLSESKVCSTLTKLKIKVAIFFDCLFLLDGRLDSLSTLIINVSHISDPLIDINESVSIISMTMFTQNTVNQINFVFL